MKVAEQFTQVSDALVDIRDQMVVMSGTVDSLVAVVAKQDTVIKRLAAANGVPSGGSWGAGWGAW